MNPSVVTKKKASQNASSFDLEQRTNSKTYQTNEIEVEVKQVTSTVTTTKNKNSKYFLTTGSFSITAKALTINFTDSG